MCKIKYILEIFLQGIKKIVVVYIKRYTFIESI